MAKHQEDVEVLLRYQIKPALLLDASGVIIATNESILRLLQSSPQNLSADSNPQTRMLPAGTHISEVGLVLHLAKIPNGPNTWTWCDLLNAAHRVFHSHRQDSDRGRMEEPRLSSLATPEDFWDQEAEASSLIECDVHYVGMSRGGVRIHAPASRYDNLLRARANVRWYERGQGVYLVTFDRPSSYRRLMEASSSVAEGSHVGGVNAPFSAVCSFKTTADTSPEEKASAEITASLIPYIMATCNTSGLVTHFSSSWYRFSGLTEEESLGAAWITAMHPEDVQRTQRSWMEVLSKGLPQWSTEARFRKATTGQYFWFLIRAQPYKDPNGQILRWYTSMMDIDEWVIARQEAERRRQSIITLFSNSEVMLWGVDILGQVYLQEGGLDWTPVNIAGPRGVNPQDWARQASLGQTGHDTNDDKGKLRSALENTLYGAGSNSVVEHKEGNRYFRTMFVAERTTSTQIVGDKASRSSVQAALALTFEITDERRQATLLLENEKLMANEKAAQEANELKGRFLANMSHEIRTPISGIIGLSEHLLSCRLDSGPKDFAKDVHETARFLLHLVNDILDLSKLDSGKMKIESIPFSLDQIIRDTLVPLQFQADEKKLALNHSCNIGTQDLLVGDPSRMRQILTNLLGNSIKFTERGSVDLDISGTPNASDRAMELKLVVRDTGIGISKEAVEKLFNPFCQADASTARIYGGTGLGLTICRDLVKLMGGDIVLQSTPGAGTIVTCTIPFNLHKPDQNTRRPSIVIIRRSSADETQDPVVAPQHSKIMAQEQGFGFRRPAEHEVKPLHSRLAASFAQHSKLLILIVDDNPINRKVNSLFVKRLGYEVALACDGQEACDYLSKTSGKQRPVMVFMDCMMPVVDGYEATRRIRNNAEVFDDQTRALPIVGLTASALQSDRDRCWEVGMNDCIGRPVTARELKAAVDKWVVTES
ncbi:Two-component system protein A 2 [Stagonosporopsis vannaccii]|nr:Two-component system protein A 2 [Stagonosporopsis vannaccii]